MFAQHGVLRSSFADLMPSPPTRAFAGKAVADE